MAGKFELYKSGNGEFRFRLVDGTGDNILSSEGYGAKPSAENGIKSVKENADDESRYELKESSNNQFYFLLKSGNGQTIGTSGMYPTADARTSGIESVKFTAPDAPVDDLS